MTTVQPFTACGEARGILAGAHDAVAPATDATPMIRCLVVDDDPDIREDVCDYLQGFAMDVRVAADGRAMRAAMAAERFDVVVLDLMLPDESGLVLCQWAQKTSDAAIIMLTAQGDPMSRVVGLELGADDYLGKPFEPRELVARIHAAVRRSQRGREAQPAGPEEGQRVRFGDWIFDRMRRQLLSAQGVAVSLSAAEYRLLTAFVERPGRPLTRDQIIDLTRAPGVDVNDRSIDLAVSRLRHKLGDTPRDPRLIRTLRGEGYLFDATVEPAP